MQTGCPSQLGGPMICIADVINLICEQEILYRYRRSYNMKKKKNYFKKVGTNTHKNKGKDD